jgi:hypothetical protein
MGSAWLIWVSETEVIWLGKDYPSEIKKNQHKVGSWVNQYSGYACLLVSGCDECDGNNLEMLLRLDNYSIAGFILTAL